MPDLRRHSDLDLAREARRREGSGAEPWYSHYHPVYGEAWSKVLSRSLRIVAVCYVSIAISAYEVFPCRSVVGRKVMTHNVDMACESKRHRAGMALGIFSFLIVIVGYPLCIWLHLARTKRRYHGLHIAHLLTRFGSFYVDYRNNVQTYWFAYESVTIVLICAACLALQNTTLSIVLVTAVLFSSYVNSLTLKPRIAHVQTRMQHNLYCSGLLFCAGSALLLEGDGSRTMLGEGHARVALGEIVVHASVVLWFYALRHSFNEAVELGLMRKINATLDDLFATQAAASGALPDSPKQGRGRHLVHAESSSGLGDTLSRGLDASAEQVDRSWTQHATCSTT